jgi:predicted DNA-binding transcriptional regulator YafY
MLQTSARLLALLSLLQLRREWSGPELADRLEVGPRTIRRDVEKLRELGYPIEAAPGVAGGYRLGMGAELPPLLLDDAEAVAVAVGLRTAAAGTIAGIEETSVRALAKLEQVLPERLRRRVRALGDATSALPIDGPRIDADLLTALASSCRDVTRVAFAYVAKDDVLSRRTVEPCAVVHTGWRWYLVAFDCDRDDWRTFRVDRIAAPVTEVARGRRREVPGGDPAAYVRSQLRARDGEPVRGRVRLHAPLAEVEGRLPARYVTASAEEEGTTLVETAAGWSAQFPVWMATLGVPFEVLDPPELVEMARGMGERLVAAGA